jgi:hypothetical protein
MNIKERLFFTVMISIFYVIHMYFGYMIVKECEFTTNIILGFVFEQLVVFTLVFIALRDIWSNKILKLLKGK